MFSTALRASVGILTARDSTPLTKSSARPLPALQEAPSPREPSLPQLRSDKVSSRAIPLTTGISPFSSHIPGAAATPTQQKQWLTVQLADLVQDLYLRELKNYKAPAVKANDSEGHVQKFSPPAPPKSPEEADIASELKAYEASTVEVEGQAEGGAATQEVDWFEEEPEEDEKHH